MIRLERMTLLVTSLSAALALGGAGVGRAQDKQPEEEPEMTLEPDDTSKPGQPEPEPEPEPSPAPDTGTEPDLGLEAGGTAAKPGQEKEEQLGESRASWQDIVVVVRKPFLKVNRLELLPTWGVTMNDNIIRHFQFAGQINYFLTDVLAVGVEGQYFVKDLREPFDLVARQARRLPTVNKYNFGAALNFHYVPIYGKFAILDSKIIHWESFFTAGVGFTQSEVLPRDPALQPFKNFLITPNVGVSMRFFLTRFLTVNLSIRDYVFVDKFEAVGRMEVDGDMAKANASSALINNVIFQAGLSFWFPTSFRYTTFR